VFHFFLNEQNPKKVPLFTHFGFCSFRKKMKNLLAWFIGEKSMRFTGLEIPEKPFPYRFF
jgi:hypothetical protein